MFHARTLRSLIAAAAAAALGAPMPAARAGNTVVTETGATQAGTEYFKVTLSDGSTVLVPIPVAKGTGSVIGGDSASKSGLLAKGFTDQGFKVKINTLGGGFNPSFTVLSDAAGHTITAIEKTDTPAGVKVTGSGETDHIAYLTPAVNPDPQRGVLAYTGPLTGIDLGGLTSIFTATLGFQSAAGLDILADVSLSFASLPDSTVAALTTATFDALRDELPVAYQGDLSLDLARQSIVFNFPTDAVNPFIGNFTSDVTGGVSASLASVPEPSSLVLLGIGLAGVIGLGRARVG